MTPTYQYTLGNLFVDFKQKDENVTNQDFKKYMIRGIGIVITVCLQGW